MISAVTPSLHIIDALGQELSALDLQLRRIAAGDELCRRFMAVPCIGPVTAVTVAAYMGDPQRFRNGRHFAAYLGVAPKHAGSGGRTVITGVGGAGMAPARRVLHEAAPIMLCWTTPGLRRARSTWSRPGLHGSMPPIPCARVPVPSPTASRASSMPWPALRRAMIPGAIIWCAGSRVTPRRQARG